VISAADFLVTEAGEEGKGGRRTTPDAGRRRPDNQQGPTGQPSPASAHREKDENDADLIEIAAHSHFHRFAFKFLFCA